MLFFQPNLLDFLHEKGWVTLFLTPGKNEMLFQGFLFLLFVLMSYV